jgi:hypothetical protein
MQAETAFSVFEALLPMEKQRLLKMLSVSDVKEKNVLVKKPIITDSQAREIIINKYKNFSKRWKTKMGI